MSDTTIRHLTLLIFHQKFEFLRKQSFTIWLINFTVQVILYLFVGLFDFIMIISCQSSHLVYHIFHSFSGQHSRDDDIVCENTMTGTQVTMSAAQPTLTLSELQKVSYILVIKYIILLFDFKTATSCGHFKLEVRNCLIVRKRQLLQTTMQFFTIFKFVKST